MALPIASAAQLGLNGLLANTNVAWQQANLNGTPAPTSNTALSNAGTTGYQTPSPNLPTFNISSSGNIVQNAPSGNIVQNAPSGASSSGSSSGGGPGGIGLGSYDASKLTQDQRQWLWQQFGHKGQASLGYGGESVPGATSPAVGPTLAPVAKIPTLPTTATSQSTAIPKGVGAATIPGSTMGGTTGSTVTPVSSPLSSLQLSGLNLGASPTAASSASMTPKLPTQNNISPQLINQLMSNQQANTPVTSQTSKATFPPLNLGAQQGEGAPITAPAGKLGGATESSPGASVIPDSWVTNTLLGALGLGGAALTGGALIPEEAAIATMLPEVEEVASSFLPKTLGNIAGGIGTAALGSKIINPDSANANLDMSKTGPQRLTDTQGNPTTTFNQANAQGNITDQNLQKTAIMSAVKDPSKIQTVASQIANPQGLQTIISLQDQAQKTGDMKSVISLANIHTAVTQQLQLIDQIGRSILATAGGFGTPNAPGVTAARLPMVQQGVGQALTGGVPPAPTMGQDTGASGAQTLIPQLQGLTSGQVQTQKPVFPYS